MEILLYIILISLLCASTTLNYVILKNFQSKKKETEIFHENLVSAITEQTERYSYTQDKIDALGNNLDRSILALRALLETTKPIRPNNWDSVKEAFKGPVRIEVNERN